MPIWHLSRNNYILKVRTQKAALVPIVRHFFLLSIPVSSHWPFIILNPPIMTTYSTYVSFLLY